MKTYRLKRTKKTPKCPLCMNLPPAGMVDICPCGNIRDGRISLAEVREQGRSREGFCVAMGRVWRIGC